MIVAIVLIVFHLIMLQLAKIVYKTYSECCEPCLFGHVNVLIRKIICKFFLYLILALYIKVFMTKLPLWDVELGTINRLYSDPKKTVILNHYLRITATSPKQ